MAQPRPQVSGLPTTARGPSRRHVLAGLGLAASAPVLGSCASRSPGDRTTLWYWTASISDKVLAAAPAALPGLRLEAAKIGGDFGARLLTTLAGHSNVPDVTGMNSDIAVYMPDEDQFVDLYELGAREVEHEYLDWKWKQGVSPTGRMIGFPMDTGPSGLFYRADVYDRAGLPSEPADLAAATSTWEDFFELGSKLRAKVPRSSPVPNIASVYGYVMAQSAQQYVTPDGHYIGDQPHVRRAWDLAVEASRRRLSAGSPDGSSEWNAGIANGRIVSLPGAVWVAASLASGAPSLAGKWRATACPGGPGNLGGSFLAVTKASRDPQRAFDLVRWLQSPANQVRGFADTELFPSAPAAYTAPALQQPSDYFGGQKTIDVFGPAAKGVKPAHFSPYDAIVSTPLTQELAAVESLGKNPDRAWSDAQSDIRRALQHAGVV